jgi:hypothetical protein
MPVFRLMSALHSYNCYPKYLISSSPKISRQQIVNTGNRPARMAISSEERTFDTLEIKPNIPEAKHFKLARKN